MNLSNFQYIQNFIGGEFKEPLSKVYIDNINPATGEKYGQIPNSNHEDVEAAVKAAKMAFPAWSTSSTETRFKILNRIAELIDENLDILALAETTDNGKAVMVEQTCGYSSCF
jgi:aminomuconate-semialdehyde/2-hydroxymuconate-6-semialdehyde dehydrogenase